MSSTSSSPSEGEQVRAAAYALGPLNPGGVGHVVEGLAIFYGIIAAIVLSIRVWVRSGFSSASPTRLWGVDDYLAFVGTLIFVPAVIFAVYAARFGVGSHDSDLPSQFYAIRAAEYEVYWELCYFVSSTIIKCAVGFTCVRLDQRKRIAIPIFINMSLIVIITILALIFVALNCRPFAATWNPYLGSCQTQISMTTVSIIVSAVQMATDWACAVMPFFIVAGLQMSVRKKVSVILILGLGVIASICTVIRLPYLKYYDTTEYPTETLYHFGIINILSTTECALGTIGCSLPSLRKLLTHYYGSTHDVTKETGSYLPQGSGNGIKLGALTPCDGSHRATAGRVKADADVEDIDELRYHEDAGHKGILRKTEVFVSHTNYSQPRPSGFHRLESLNDESQF